VITSTTAPIATNAVNGYDPAEVFACSFRITGRLHRRQPEISKVLLHNALALARADRGLAPRARRDLDAANRAGRFTVDDPELAWAVIAGATLCLGQLLHDQPERDDAHATDQVTEDLLRMLGVPADEAHRICLRPLPVPGDPAGHEPQNVGTGPPFPRRPAQRTGQRELTGTRGAAGTLPPCDENADQR
jgi:hypothetical protein